jgi:uncharacterized protein YndB with AHSA1/START domain
MNQMPLKPRTHDIEIEEVLAHPPGKVWRALTSGGLMARWLMPPSGFEPVEGNRFTFQTTPAGEWDGTIRCQVLEVVPGERFAFSWRGGHIGNEGYGSLLDTVVTFTLAPVDGGTRLSLVHAGFVVPRNQTAYRSMSEGWRKVVGRLDELASETPTKENSNG